MLRNHTPYAVERNWTRDKNGAHWWLVSAKATFDIDAKGDIALAPKQLPPLLQPEYRGEESASSLRLDSDLLMRKTGTDVIVDAHAYAPRGKPSPTVLVTLRVGDLEKSLIVHGLRVYYRGALGIRTSSPLPFNKHPIHYEWAYGGSDFSLADPEKHRIDMRNPVGKGVASDERTLIDQPAHAIEYPSGKPSDVGPAGFGPIAAFWSPRLEFAGTYDARWNRTKKPLLPDDYNERFAFSAPLDQRLESPLRGGESVDLRNMTRSGILRFKLPRIHLRCSTSFGDRSVEHPAIISSLIIEPDEMRALIVWQSSLKVPARDVERLDATTIEERRSAV